MARLYGIPNPFPDLDGGKVEEMNLKTLVEYCANDVKMTRELARRTFGWYWY